MPTEVLLGRVLVVDDTEAVRYATSRVLRRAGFEVLEAENGADALTSVRDQRPDLIVLDVKLPDINGFEVCQLIKGDPSTSGIPVLQTSAEYVDSGSRVAGLDAGADAYLTHPFSEDELLATLSALLRIRRAEEQERRQANEARAARDELRKALAALTEKNQALQALIEASPLAIIAIDVEGRVKTWNAAAELMFGWRQEEVRGKPLPTLLPEEKDAPEELARRGERLTRLDAVWQAKNGKRMPVNLSSAPLYDSGVNLQGAMLVVSDETSHKIADEALRRHEQLVANGRMASALAHEINNPLAAVLNALYLLRQRKDLDASAREFVQIADEQLARVAQITTQVLAVHRKPGDLEHSRIADLIEGSLSLYFLHLRENRINLRRDYDVSCIVAAPGSDVRQILSNLIGNAIEAVGSGGSVAIRAREQRSCGRQGMRITIADNGPGISAEDRAHIFEPFFTSKGEKGTGLGLWIVNSIVHKHQGSIRLRSSTQGPRRGTTFSVFLPHR